MFNSKVNNIIFNKLQCLSVYFAGDKNARTPQKEKDKWQKHIPQKKKRKRQF